MDRDFYTDEFEQFLKSKADQHRLYASDEVWKKIYNTLHPPKKRMMAALLFLMLFLFTGDQVILFKTSKHEMPGSRISNELATNNFLKQIKTGLDFTSKSNATIPSPVFLPQTNTYRWLHNANLIFPKALVDKLTHSALEPATVGLEKQQPDTDTKLFADNNLYRPLEPYGNTKKEIIPKYNNIAPTANNTAIPVVTANITSAGVHNIDAKSIVSKDEPKITEPVFTSVPIVKTSIKRPVSLQYYFSPSISFRKMEDQTNTNQELPIFAYHDVNRFVNHSPSIGIEAGSSLLFPLSKSISLKAGLQLNVNGYNIQAFTFSREKATIALNTPYGGRRDTISAFTYLRNQNGYMRESLHNRYFQISMPVGVDIKIIGDDRLQLNTAATFQPFYVMANSTYLLSNDYNNYVKERSLVRKWNYAASMEVYISHTTKRGVKWQVGPQFRYQLQPNYSSRYPIKEYLTEYGLKFGIIKPLK